jgi:hypothetical protein
MMMGVRLSFWAMLGWVWMIGLLIGAAGVWPTWQVAGRRGLEGELLAVAVVLSTMLASALVVLRLARRGPAVVAAVFVIGGAVRLAVVLTAALILGHVLRPHAVAFLLWVAVFYLVTILGEGFWLARAMK